MEHAGPANIFRASPLLEIVEDTNQMSHIGFVGMPDVANAIAHISPDVSDPYVYIANGAAGLSVVELLNAPVQGETAAELLDTVAIPGNLTATEVTLAGDIAYVGTAEGTVEVFDLANPEVPSHVTSVEILQNEEVRGIEVGVFLHAEVDVAAVPR